MPSDAARLEVLGETDAVVDFHGYRLSIPLDLQRWPLPLIEHGSHIAAVDALLGGQDVGDTTVDDYRRLSDLMALAVGVDRLPETPDAPDQWFGGVPTLLELLRNHESDVASDLMGGWGVELDNRFRPVGDARRLTLRKIWTYVRRLPATSAVALAKNGGKTVWTEEMFIAAGIFEALTGKTYEGRPMRPEEVERLVKAMQAQADHVAKLKASTARYAAAAQDPAGGPLATAMAEAIANRQRELGHPEDE